jgi:tetratricopeptide (TPR) repeat protein
VPPFDREAALKNAEKAMRMGRVDAAIAEYVKIVEAQPRDWNSANALGDLYVRAGQKDKGVSQYFRIADHLGGEGFYPKAAALYKKILKVRPDDETALLQLGELSAKQGLLADAKSYLQQVAERRRSRGDKKGAAALSVRLGTLDPEDLASRQAAAKAAADMGDTATALRELKDVAARLEKKGKSQESLAVLQQAFELDRTDEGMRERLFQGFLDDGSPELARQLAKGSVELKKIAAALDRAGRPEAVLEVLSEVAKVDPDDLEVRTGLAQAYVARGDLEQARAFLSPETAGENAALWLTLGEIELRGGRYAEGRAAVAEAIRIDKRQREDAVVLGCRISEIAPDSGYQCIEAVAESALADGDYGAAAAALHEFVTRVRNHLVALMRLVEICVDGGLEATMYEAQAQLADAYLDVGRGLEARIISEDLVAREPWNRANLERFRRALVMLGEQDPDAIIADRLSGESPFLSTDKLDLNEGFDPRTDEKTGSDAPPADGPSPETADGASPDAADGASPDAANGPAAPAASHDDEFDEDVVDLSGALEHDSEPAPSAPAQPAKSLDQVFKQFRDEVGRQSTEDAAAEQYRLALSYRDMGNLDDAIKALESAARSPRQRFDAASMLGRVYSQKGEQTRAVEWMERAAEAPAPTPDSGRALLYDLAEMLEKVGESSRALAVFVELESESGGYRDVARRIERLSKAQARG